MDMAFVLNREDMISLRGFSREVGIVTQTVSKGIKRGYFQPQMFGKDPATGRAIIAFHEDYAADVKRVLPKNTVNGATIFTDEFRVTMTRINKKWLGKKVKW